MKLRFKRYKIFNIKIERDIDLKFEWHINTFCLLRRKNTTFD